MLTRFITATAISALMATGALAQANPPAGSSSTPGASSTTGAGSTMGTSSSSTSASSGASSSGAGASQFVQSQSPDEFLATRFRGTDVIGQNNEKIGDVNDILFDRQGKVHAVIVGVGGFLGIGEKDVALPMTAFQIVPADTGAGANTSSNTSASGSNTGSATSGSAAGASTRASNDPTNVKLKLSMTKDQLNSAPTFQQIRARGGGSAGDTGAGASTTGRSGSGAATGATPRP